MRGSSAQKMKLTSYDDLFGGDGQESGEAVTSVPIRELHPFRGHPFRVLDDAKMQETVESVKKYGVLVLRPIFYDLQLPWLIVADLPDIMT